MSNPGFPAVPEFEPDDKTHRRKLARTINGLLGGKANVTLDVTLSANASTTTISDARIGYYSAIVPAMPMTANAAAELGNGTLYIPQATMQKGQAVIHHANNAQTDRTIRFVILG